ncbi:MAG: hypothetical protein JRJ19_14075 [Deltaproteobacteria bacterium]|nr:hypothetical protein [Deltaproteobacteria bacterium]
MGRKIAILVGFIIVAAGTFLALEMFMKAPQDTQKVEPIPPPLENRPDKKPEEQPPIAEPPPDEVPDLKTIEFDKPRKLTKSGKKTINIEPKEDEPAKDKPEKLTAVFTVKDTVPPLLSILSPVDRFYTMKSKLKLTVRSEAGARVELNGQPFTEKSPGYFNYATELTDGLNRFVVAAYDAVGNRAEAAVRVTYVAPSRIRKKKDRFEALLKQLDEVRSAAFDIDRTISELLKQIEYAADAERVPQLSAELRTIRHNRTQLQMEIEQGIKEIDSWLSRSE